MTGLPCLSPDGASIKLILPVFAIMAARSLVAVSEEPRRRNHRKSARPVWVLFTLLTVFVWSGTATGPGGGTAGCSDAQ